MNTATIPSLLTQRPFRPFGTKRVLLLAVGSISLLLALGLLAGGGAAIWGVSQRDNSGYFTTAAHQLSTGSYALTSDTLRVGTEIPGWVFSNHVATVRLQAAAAQPVFIGIARTTDVSRYLANVAHTRITNFDSSPFSVRYRAVPGNTPPTAPASQSFWRVKASGPGTQTISFPLEKGNWSAVAMNADGSRRVTAAVRLGANVHYLGWIAAAFLAAGALGLLAATTFVYLGARRPRISSSPTSTLTQGTP